MQTIKTLIHEKIFKLEEINEAHQEFESGKYLGKIVIENSEKLK